LPSKTKEKGRGGRKQILEPRRGTPNGRGHTPATHKKGKRQKTLPGGIIVHYTEGPAKGETKKKTIAQEATLTKEKKRIRHHVTCVRIQKGLRLEKEIRETDKQKPT